MQVCFDGSYIRELESMIALVDDMRLAMGSCVGVVAYLIFHTRSLTLSMVGLTVAFSSVPMAYVVSALLFGTTTITFASGLSL